MPSKMALTPSTVLSASPKMMVMLSGWLARVCTQEEQRASGCQQERLTLLSASIIDLLEVPVFVINGQLTFIRRNHYTVTQFLKGLSNLKC